MLKTIVIVLIDRDAFDAPPVAPGINYKPPASRQSTRRKFADHRRANPDRLGGVQFAVQKKQPSEDPGARGSSRNKFASWLPLPDASARGSQASSQGRANRKKPRPPNIRMESISTAGNTWLATTKTMMPTRKKAVRRAGLLRSTNSAAAEVSPHERTLIGRALRSAIETPCHTSGRVARSASICALPLSSEQFKCHGNSSARLNSPYRAIQ